MNRMTRPWTILAPMLRNVWTVPVVCALAMVFFGLTPRGNGSPVHHEGCHPGTCRSCAWSSAQRRAARDAWMIEHGAIENPDEPDALPVEVRTPIVEGIAQVATPRPFFGSPGIGQSHAHSE